MTDRPFRFGVVAGFAPNVDSLTTLARRAEESGYHTLLTPDPLAGHDPLTALSAVAATTSTLHFGTFVLAVSYRDTRQLAWQAQTLHALSGGRFELGLGTGRPDAEARAERLGREFGSGRQRADWLAKTVAEISQLEDRPKLLLAGAGPRLLELAARKADIVSLTWRPQTTEAEADVVIDRFKQAAGPRAAEIELNLNLIAVGDQPAPWVEQYIGTSTEELARGGAVTVLPGTPDQCADTLLRWRDRWGVSYITVHAGFLERFASTVQKLSGSTSPTHG
jgi:probable F420-dependent oxidoreductase